MRLLVVNGWLAEGSVVAVERSVRGPDIRWPDALTENRVHRYGETVLTYADYTPR